MKDLFSDKCNFKTECCKKLLLFRTILSYVTLWWTYIAVPSVPSSGTECVAREYFPIVWTGVFVCCKHIQMGSYSLRILWISPRCSLVFNPFIFHCIIELLNVIGKSGLICCFLYYDYFKSQRYQEYQFCFFVDLKTYLKLLFCFSYNTSDGFCTYIPMDGNQTYHLQLIFCYL